MPRCGAAPRRGSNGGWVGSRAVRGGGRVAGAVVVGSLAFASVASADSYVVLYKGNAVPASAKTDVQKAGGTFVAGYDQIGVAVARSDSSSFSTAIAKDSRVEGVSST